VKIGKLSARNVFAGKIVEIKRGTVAAQVKVEIGGGHIVTSSITVDAVDHLGLKPGSEVVAIIKASSVMLGIPD